MATTPNTAANRPATSSQRGSAVAANRRITPYRRSKPSAIACPVNAVDSTASASTPGVTASIRGSGSGTRSSVLSPTSSTIGTSRVSSTCSPLRKASRSSVPDCAASIRHGEPAPGRGVKVPGGTGSRPLLADARRRRAGCCVEW